MVAVRWRRRCIASSATSDEETYWIDGRLLTERDLQDIRAQVEGFARVEAITDEMRDVIETQCPELAETLLPPKDEP
jgi:hypothetical protein